MLFRGLGAARVDLCLPEYQFGGQGGRGHHKG